ncbi:MAG: hypothetical protein NC311_08175 [Muribaculaceae bacterium]|nr:hypothetical protein [Muribaculaceae bacterium]MCM1439324.1 hypothetical protein [Roseburia sp.]
MSKNITTRQSIETLALELKKKFATQEGKLEKAFKSGKVEGNTVSFYTSADGNGAAAFTLDFPAELFLDQTKTVFVPKFAFSEETYPGATDPKLEGKPVMVLAVKGEGENANYSFLNMAALVDTYTAKSEGKDSSTTVTVAGYEVEVKVNISEAEGNQLQLKEDGLFVPSSKVAGAVEGHLAALDGEGNLTDSGKSAADFVPVVEGDDVVRQSDIKDFTAEEIAALLAD